MYMPPSKIATQNDTKKIQRRDGIHMYERTPGEVGNKVRFFFVTKSRNLN